MKIGKVSNHGYLVMVIWSCLSFGLIGDTPFYLSKKFCWSEV